MNNESEEICGGYLSGYPKPVISVKSPLFSADSEKAIKSCYVVSIKSEL